MTREQAKREIDSLDFYLQNHTDDYGEESHTAMMMAIKALEQQTCEDAVSREAVLGLFAQNADAVRPYSTAWEKIRDLPPVNPQPKTGQWIEDDDPEIINPWLRCSLCGGTAPLHDIGEGPMFNLSDYCPDCGAKMVEPQESEVNK